MSDFSLVPVDYQPDFGDVSFVPVDYDPFGAGGTIQPTQPEGQPRPSPANTGAPVIDGRTAASGEYSNPHSTGDRVSGQATVHSLTATPISPPTQGAVDWSTYNRPIGELKAESVTPTRRIGYLAADALMGLGMQPYTANDLASRIGNVLGLTPLGVAGSALDLIKAKRQDDFPGAVAAAIGMIPGARGSARAMAEETAASVARKLDTYLLNPDHIKGGPKAKWFQQALGFTRENAGDLAKQLIFDESQAVRRGANEYGTHFDQNINVTGANGRTIAVTTGWTIGPDGVPRLVTAIPSR